MELLECPECGNNTAWIDDKNPKILHCSVCCSEFEIEIGEPNDQTPGR